MAGSTVETDIAIIGGGGGAADEVWARFYLEHTLHDLYHRAESCSAKCVAAES